MSDTTKPSPGVFRHVPGARWGLMLMLAASVAGLLSDGIRRLVESASKLEPGADVNDVIDSATRLSAIFLPFNFSIFLGLCVGLALLARVPKSTGVAVGSIVCGIAAWLCMGAGFAVQALWPYMPLPRYLLGGAAAALLVAALSRAADGLGASFPRALAALLYLLIGVVTLVGFGVQLASIVGVQSTDPRSLGVYPALMQLINIGYYARQVLLIAGMITMLVTQPSATKPVAAGD
jgi:hypothetical protein